ncbi:MAG TPA: hypothetical protein VGC72_14010 [Candidatus Elarobacter sp.]
MTAGVENVVELLRLPSPAPRPHALAHDGERLWMGSVETSRIYSIDPAAWTARFEGVTPGAHAGSPQGKPWGMTVAGDDLRVCYGINDDDDRVIQKFVPGHGFHGPTIPCPDWTGSQLSFDGDRLFLSQFYNGRLMAIADDGTVGTVIELGRQIVGHVVVSARFYVITARDESDDVYYLTRVDARGAAPVIEDVARIPFEARSLAFDGERFWTSHREAHEIVAFARPDGS